MRDRDLLNSLLRSEFKSFLYRCTLTLNPGAPFLPNWHIEAFAHQLQRVRNGDITRLINSRRYTDVSGELLERTPQFGGPFIQQITWWPS